jgi:hypothetical protein
VIAFLIIHGDADVKRPRFVLAHLHYSVMTAISGDGKDWHEFDALFANRNQGIPF